VRPWISSTPATMIFLLSKRARKAIGVALMIGLAFVPPVKGRFVGQAEHHAEHVTRESMRQFAPGTSVPSPRVPSQGPTRHR
jgi:hypothetical protein